MLTQRRKSMGHSANYRVTKVTNSGSREVTMMDEQELQKLRAKRLQQIRKDELGLTQKSPADAICVNLRTLQDWEIGRSPMPKPVEILMNLMRDMPNVKEKLLTSSCDY
jgi:DNA-binding transcriptional regulator YiaG